MDGLIKTGKREAAYKTKQNFYGIRNPKSGAIENREDKMIYEQELIAEKLKEYLETLYDGKELTGQESGELSEFDQDEKYLVLREES